MNNLNKYVYPAITLAILGLGAFLVGATIRFISSEVNSIFAIDQARVEANIAKVNLEQYSVVAERLKFTVPKQ